MATDGGDSSRRSLAGAGWACTNQGSYAGLVPRRARRFNWLNPVPLVQSRNDRIARRFGDPTGDRRRAWVKELGRAPGDDLLIDLSDRDEIAFLVLGDTGEGDHSQYAVVPPLLSQAPGTAFAFVLSDVIYPAGGVNEYEDKFFRPYKDYPGPIYAVPGNHDWYDDANGFMFWFCGAESPPPKGSSGGGLGGLVRRVLWRRAQKPDRAAVERMRSLRDSSAQRARQPGPYLAIDAGPVRLVGIDTGITGELDSDQGAWLRRVSSNSERPKILLTGKPIYVDGKHREGKIEGGGTVDEIVRDPAHRYIAAIGGDIHNYQRYPVRLGDGRTIQYLVSGGGGAFMHQTHSIENLDTLALPGVPEEDFRLYPLRGDSLSRYSE